MNKPYRVDSETYVLPTYLHVPGVGVLAINAFVVLGEEPVLVDTGIGREQQDFMQALKSIIDPADLRWIWLTHDDMDHIGSLRQLMGAAPKAKLATHALCALRMSTSWPVPLERVHAISLNENIDVGGRKLIPIRPPLFDSPFSIGFHDEKSGNLFSVDAFGAFLPREETDIANCSEKELSQGMLIWATSDSPWIHAVDESKYGNALEQVRLINPKAILSSHLPMAREKTDLLLKILASLPSSQPFVLPSQEAFSHIVAGLKSAHVEKPQIA